ncbi:MAG: TRAP transporter substrate-binding protein [Tenericutes bacterium]|nr:TRAP transporter substrate-binding protein [Mycoplasmatota bacterium]
MKKFLLVLTLAFVAVFTFACGSNEESEVITIKLAHYAEIGHPADIAANQFKENVEERTNGSVIIEIYPANQLGSPDEVLEQNILGTVDMSLPTQGHLSRYSNKFATVMLPFVFEDYDHVYRTLDGPFMDWVAPDLERQGLVFLSNWDWGFRNITNSVRPINSPADVAGLKLRTPPEVQLQAAMEALGAQVQQIAFSELITALNTGAVDGQENPLAVIYYNSLYESQTHLAITNHVYNSMVNVMSKTVWDQLSEEQQVIIKEESVAAGNYMRQMMRDDAANLIALLEAEGMTVTYPDVSLFKAEMEEAYTRIGAIFGVGNVEYFLQIAEDAKND